jgi:DNA-directed RNA polymerase specialized sigma24 family protein
MGGWRFRLQRSESGGYVPSAADALLAESFAYEPLLRARLHHAFGGDTALIDDGLQEVYARLLVMAESGGVRVRRLRTLLFELVADVLKKTSPPEGMQPTVPSGPDEDDIDDADPMENDLEQLVEAAGHFPPLMRQAFTLRKVYGQSSPEIAHTLNLPEQEVEKLLVLAAQACARRLFDPNRPQPAE